MNTIIVNRIWYCCCCCSFLYKEHTRIYHQSCLFRKDFFLKPCETIKLKMNCLCSHNFGACLLCTILTRYYISVVACYSIRSQLFVQTQPLRHTTDVLGSIFFLSNVEQIMYKYVQKCQQVTCNGNNRERIV